MKIKNYVSQKSSNTTALIVAVLLALVTTETSHADTCSLKKTDLRADSAALMEKILSDSEDRDPSFKKVSYSPEKSAALDHKFHNVDRTAPYLSGLNGIGILTNKPFANGPTAHGSATLIGSCYVLTNKHVVKAILAERGRSLTLDETFNFSVGQPINCASKNQFEAMNQQVRLVDHGDDQVSPKAIQSDWAILKLSKPIKGIASVPRGSPYFKKGDVLLRGGYPGEEVEKNRGVFQLSGQVVKSVAINVGGTATVSETEYHPGLSGGGVFTTKDEAGDAKLSLVGISAAVNTDGRAEFLPLRTIQTMVAKSGRLNWSEVTRISDSESCD